MATPQGNFTAYQQLKPTELKVGDIYNKAIDELIKNNQAQQAAALKQKMQQNQSLDKLIFDIGDSFKGIKTTSAMSAFASNYTKQVGDTYGELSYKASITTDPAEKQRYLQEALRLKNEYTALKSSLESVDFDNIALQDNKNLAEGKAWAGDDKLYVRQLYNNGLLKPTRGEDGNFYVAVPKGANAKPDDPAEMVPVSDFFSRYYGNALEVDVSNNTLDEVAKEAIKARDSKAYTAVKNRNGTSHDERRLSDEDRKGVLNQYFNMKEYEFDVKRVPTGIRQYFYNQTGKYMETYKDYLETRAKFDEYIKTRVPTDIKDKQIYNTNVNVRNFTSSGDKATIDAMKKISQANIYVKYANGNDYGHSSAYLPNPKGTNGNHYPSVSVVYDKDANIYRYYRVGLNKPRKQSIGTEVERSEALNLVSNAISNSASSETVLQGMENVASGLNGKGTRVTNVDMNLYDGSKGKNKGGGKGKPF